MHKKTITYNNDGDPIVRAYGQKWNLSDMMRFDGASFWHGGTHLTNWGGIVFHLGYDGDDYAIVGLQYS